MNRARTVLAVWRSGEGGAAAVEFALLLPLMMILLFGFLEVGRLIWDYHIVTASVRDAARYAARFDASCAAGGALVGDLARIKRLARTGSVDGTTPLIPGWTNDATVTVTVTCVDNPGGTTWTGRYKGMTQFPRVTVSAAAPHRTLFGGLLPGLTLNTITVADQQAWTA
jgi:Flp pilus assembly protein TadG